ncbi:MAG: hypothetical protein O9273_15030 [Acetobacteraceae bacterium]|nr:hypothetical protein [Acetobacteraceae bacterium]
MLTRRNALLGLGFATAACAGELGGTGLPPGIQTGNIAPDDNLVLGPDENILVGMVARVHRIASFAKERSMFGELGDLSEQSVMGARAASPFLTVDRPFFVFEASSQKQFGVPAAGWQPDLKVIRHSGEIMRMLPFAMRVPKGPHRIIAGIYANPRGWNWLRVPSLQSGPRPGTVAYVGRIGQITQFSNYTPAAFQEQRAFLFPSSASSSRNHLIDLPLFHPFQLQSCAFVPGGGRDAFCWFANLFFHDDADRDLPLLLQQFPKLATAQIDTALLTPGTREGWGRWPEVLRSSTAS